MSERRKSFPWMNGDKMCTHGVSGLPKHARCDAGLIALSNSQPSQWHRRHPETSQPALTDRPCLSSVSAARLLVRAELVFAHKIKCLMFDWHTRRSKHIPRSFNRLLHWKAEQKSDLSAGPPSALLQNLGKSHGWLVKIQHTAGWTTKCGYADTAVTYYTVRI